MSQENVDLVRSGMEAWNAGDLDSLRGTYAPEVVGWGPEGWPESGPFVGRDALMRQWQRMRDAWDAQDLKMVSDYIDAGDRVAVRLVWHGAGRGPDADLAATAVFTVRKGRVRMVEFFWDHAEALEAVGLSEQDANADSRARDTARAMPQENVEIVRRWLATVSRGTEEALASLPEFCDPDIDYYPVRKFPEATPCHGLDELSRFLAQYLDAWRVESVIQDLIEVGDERVLARGILHTEGRGSGVKLKGVLHQCFWLRNGRVFRQEDHLTLRGALDALGLEGGTLEAVRLSEQDA